MGRRCRPRTPFHWSGGSRPTRPRNDRPPNGQDNGLLECGSTSDSWPALLGVHAGERALPVAPTVPRAERHVDALASWDEPSVDRRHRDHLHVERRTLTRAAHDPDVAAVERHRGAVLGTSSPSIRSVVSSRGVPSAAISLQRVAADEVPARIELDHVVEPDLERVRLAREVVDVGEQQAGLDPQRLDRGEPDRPEAVRPAGLDDRAPQLARVLGPAVELEAELA